MKIPVNSELEQRLLVDAVASSATLWDVTSAAGAVGVARLFVRRVTPGKLARALAGADVVSDQWVAVGLVGTAETPATVDNEDLYPELTITSQDDDTAYTIAGQRTEAGGQLIRFTLRRLPG